MTESTRESVNVTNIIGNNITMLRDGMFHAISEELDNSTVFANICRKDIIGSGSGENRNLVSLI